MVFLRRHKSTIQGLLLGAIILALWLNAMASDFAEIY